MTDDEACDFLANADANLKKKDLSFAKVNDIYEKYMQFEDFIRPVDDKKFNNKVCDRIKDYETIVQYITNGNVENIQNVLKDYDNSNFHIWPQHAEQIRKILKDDSAIERFRNNFSNITI